MKTIKLGLISFAATLFLGIGVVLLSPPEAKSDVCRWDCGVQEYCGGPGTCESPYVPLIRCNVPANMPCEPENFICACGQVGCVIPC